MISFYLYNNYRLSVIVFCFDCIKKLVLVFPLHILLEVQSLAKSSCLYIFTAILSQWKPKMSNIRITKCYKIQFGICNFKIKNCYGVYYVSDCHFACLDTLQYFQFHSLSQPTNTTLVHFWWLLLQPWYHTDIR